MDFIVYLSDIVEVLTTWKGKLDWFFISNVRSLLSVYIYSRLSTTPALQLVSQSTHCSAFLLAMLRYSLSNLQFIFG